jgi:hypothetical protein
MNQPNTNHEVARLMELLNRAIEVAEDLSMVKGLNQWCNCTMCQKLNAIKAEARLTPAPEEAVTGPCLICRENQTTCSSGICGKCYALEEPTLCPHYSIAPLKQGDMIVHQCSRCGKKLKKYPKPQEEMPLDDSDHIHHWMRLQESINRNIADELHKLRDEIQKIKNAK